MADLITAIFAAATCLLNNMQKHTNKLINETSPYLLQHAHNPVSWHAWNNEAWQKAKAENKLVLISVGYSACHWCHVMEHESFEDEEVANVMNENFICIKVDREERPDIDHIYMTAVQLMTQHGGWPLNCFALPDGKPVYGGTYFRKEQWINILTALADGFKAEPDKFYDYAEKLTDGIKKSEAPFRIESEQFNAGILHSAVKNMSARFDDIEGGMNYAPKFPMPNNYLLLLRYGYLSAKYGSDKSLANKALNHALLTLNKMAWGGIYDQIAGGFARYSTDMVWKAPHFEKMLYDNAQLVSTYCEAYQISKNETYKQVVTETLAFVQSELTSPEGFFYSALDADTEGEEGKYYVWSKEELEQILGSDYPLAENYYSVNHNGKWESHYILLRRKTDEEIKKQFCLSDYELSEKIKTIKEKLLNARAKRTKPGLDDKSLCSWNALMLKAYADAYYTFGNKNYLATAQRCAENILIKMRAADGGLFHSYKNGRETIAGFLEDYAFTIEALIALYKCDYNEAWLKQASLLADYCIKHFYNNTSKLFWFTSNNAEQLIMRHHEMNDNVIPASNSVMANVLFDLAKLQGNTLRENTARTMLLSVQMQIRDYLSGYSNWALLFLKYIYPHFELALVGNSVNELAAEFKKHYLPNAIFACSNSPSEMALVKNRFVDGKNLIYVCENNSCKMPVEKLEDALLLMQ